jgi:hypothetical protein
LYKCKDCGRQFPGGHRRDKSQVITDYVDGKQSIEQLAIKYGVNELTIRRDLEGMPTLSRKTALFLCATHNHRYFYAHRIMETAPPKLRGPSEAFF